jgi:D-aminopeptidase
VPGVLVGHTTIIRDKPRMARTGVTVIAPREGNIWKDNCFAGFHSFNGCGEMTGIHWVRESGMLCSPIAITCTHSVGAAHEALVKYGAQRAQSFIGALPVVAETYDGWLSDADAHHLTHADVFAALDSATSGPVAEGCVGGGTGMICHEFKGGIGTASRVAQNEAGAFTVGALVQCNHGDRSLFRVDGVPVGREIGTDKVPMNWAEPADQANAATGGSSIIIVIATDASLIAPQCNRLAQRATAGMARVGGVGYNGSGDLFFAFATGNHVSENDHGIREIKMLANRDMNELFEATVEAVEEAILNALVAAETTTGFKGRVVHALPHEELQRVMARYHTLGATT